MSSLKVHKNDLLDIKKDLMDAKERLTGSLPYIVQIALNCSKLSTRDSRVYETTSEDDGEGNLITKILHDYSSFANLYKSFASNLNTTANNLYNSGVISELNSIINDIETMLKSIDEFENQAISVNGETIQTPLGAKNYSGVSYNAALYNPYNVNFNPFDIKQTQQLLNDFVNDSSNPHTGIAVVDGLVMMLSNETRNTVYDDSDIDYDLVKAFYTDQGMESVWGVSWEDLDADERKRLANLLLTSNDNYNTINRWTNLFDKVQATADPLDFIPGSGIIRETMAGTAAVVLPQVAGEWPLLYHEEDEEFEGTGFDKKRRAFERQAFLKWPFDQIERTSSDGTNIEFDGPGFDEEFVINAYESLINGFGLAAGATGDILGDYVSEKTGLKPMTGDLVGVQATGSVFIKQNGQGQTQQAQPQTQGQPQGQNQQPGQPAQIAQPAQVTQPAQTSAPAQTNGPAQTSAPAQTAAPAQEAQPTQTSQPAKPSGDAPIELPKPATPAKPAPAEVVPPKTGSGGEVLKASITDVVTAGKEDTKVATAGVAAMTVGVGSALSNNIPKIGPDLSLPSLAGGATSPGSMNVPSSTVATVHEGGATDFINSLTSSGGGESGTNLYNNNSFADSLEQSLNGGSGGTGSGGSSNASLANNINGNGNSSTNGSQINSKSKGTSSGSTTDNSTDDSNESTTKKSSSSSSNSNSSKNKDDNKLGKGKNSGGSSNDDDENSEEKKRLSSKKEETAEDKDKEKEPEETAEQKDEKDSKKKEELSGDEALSGGRIAYLSDTDKTIAKVATGTTVGGAIITALLKALKVINFIAFILLLIAIALLYTTYRITHNKIIEKRKKQHLIMLEKQDKKEENTEEQIVEEESVNEVVEEDLEEKQATESSEPPIEERQDLIIPPMKDNPNFEEFGTGLDFMNHPEDDNNNQ